MLLCVINIQPWALYFAELGSYLAAKHIGIVYGGSRYGCLGKMADAAAANGGSVTAIVPEFFTSEHSV